MNTSTITLATQLALPSIKKFKRMLINLIMRSDCHHSTGTYYDVGYPSYKNHCFKSIPVGICSTCENGVPLGNSLSIIMGQVITTFIPLTDLQTSFKVNLDTTQLVLRVGYSSPDSPNSDDSFELITPSMLFDDQNQADKISDVTQRHNLVFIPYWTIDGIQISHKIMETIGFENTVDMCITMRKEHPEMTDFAQYCVQRLSLELDDLADMANSL